MFPDTYYYQPRHIASRMELHVFFFRSRCEGDSAKERKWVRVKMLRGKIYALPHTLPRLNGVGIWSNDQIWYGGITCISPLGCVV
jgi:hypothetical protein